MTEPANHDAAWWAAVHPIHCRDDRCNGGATCSCPCHAPGYAGELDAPADETPTRLDDLERQVGELVERANTAEQRLDLISGAAHELTAAVSNLFELVVGRAPGKSAPAPAELPEDVPQRTRTGEATPTGDLRERWARGEH
jgi:hypothetical protein